MQSSITPAGIEALATRLRDEAGTTANVEVTSQGYSHSQTQQKFLVLVTAKRQRLNPLFSLQEGIEVLDVLTKRSGANVKTEINLKVNLV